MSTHIQDPAGPHSLPGRRPLIEIGWQPEETPPRWTQESPAGKCLMAIRAGAHFSEAAVYASISTDTIKRWLTRGRTYMLDAFDEDCSDEDISLLPPNQQMYVTFYRSAARNEATVAVEMVGVWRQAAQDDWRAARDFLARRFPAEWQPRDRLELSASDARSDGDAVAIDTLLNDPQSRELLAALEERIAIGAGERGHGDHGEDADIVDVEVLEVIDADSEEVAPPPIKIVRPDDDDLIG